MGMRWQPSLQVIPHYESNIFYISALIKSIEKKVASISWKPDLIISSYHGIPKKYFDKGDPYHCYCHKTTRLMKEKYKSINIETTFQSRFGPQEWLTPYTDKTLESLPKEGKKNVLAICPGFSSDCVETLEEIQIQGKESFLECGGENFDMVPCLNDNDDHIILLKSLIQKNI
jgi:ferrochelatase